MNTFCLVFAFALFRNIFRVNSPINKPSIENFQKGRGDSAKKKCTELELELKAKTSVIFCEDMRVKEKFFYPVYNLKFH